MLICKLKYGRWLKQAKKTDFVWCIGDKVAFYEYSDDLNNNSLSVLLAYTTQLSGAIYVDICFI